MKEQKDMAKEALDAANWECFLTYIEAPPSCHA